MAKPFTVIVPKTINDSNFITSTVLEPDTTQSEAAYNPATSYGVGPSFRVVSTITHKIYESLQADNVGHTPHTSPTWWVEVGPSNRWAAFDSSGGTYTKTSGTPLEFSFTADRATSIALVELTARSVRIRASATGYGTYYDQTYSLGDRAVIQNWYDYFTADSFLATELIVTDIPAIPATTFTITIENNTNPLQLGNFIVGNAIELGATQYGAKIGNTSYSKKDVDEFGKATIVKRGFSKKMDCVLKVENTVVDSVAARLNYLDATPCLWVGANGAFESLTVYGFYKDYSVDISGPTHSLCSLQIEGLV